MSFESKRHRRRTGMERLSISRSLSSLTLAISKNQQRIRFERVSVDSKKSVSLSINKKSQAAASWFQRPLNPDS